MDVDTRALRYFAAVAETLNYTRAAELLFISQPALSRQIRVLENDLRTPLFTRTSREVRLTAAGEVLLPSARRLVAEWQEAVRGARSAAASRAGVLRIGFVAAGAGELGTRARALFEKEHPGVRIEFHRYDWCGEVPALREGLVDVAFIWPPADLAGLRHEVVATEPRVVALSVDHPLAASESVGILELRDVPLVRNPRATQEFVDWWAVNPRPDGSAPLWGPENDNPEELLEHVAAGVAGATLPASMASFYARPDVAWVPIHDIEPLRVLIGCPATAPNPLAVRFLDTVHSLLPPPAP